MGPCPISLDKETVVFCFSHLETIHLAPPSAAASGRHCTRRSGYLLLIVLEILWSQDNWKEGPSIFFRVNIIVKNNHSIRKQVTICGLLTLYLTILHVIIVPGGPNVWTVFRRLPGQLKMRGSDSDTWTW